MTVENKNNVGQPDPELQKQLAYLEAAFPFVPYAAASRLFSTVRRMQAEEKLGIPIHHRSSWAVSTKTGLPANQMDEAGWNQFYQQLTADLHNQYPHLYASLINEIDEM